ncbi:MAG TPA: alpha/beta fold hydrolase [Gemmataceae bacterium]|jgi:alpha-beta hydrolase superfamily lysophospholipase|nr:alpha/beta fold hydrolase [Gemmataceae bacterium]
MSRKRLLIGGLFGALLAILWFGGAGVAAFAITHRRHSDRFEIAPTEPAFESLRISTRDGEELGAWYRPGDPDRAVVVLLHGVGANRSSVLEPARLFADRGCGTLLLTQRCHGDSTGSYCDFGYSARLDLVAAAGWIESNHPGRKIVVWGTSMGAATACFAAEELGPRVHGYFLDCCYADLETATRNRMHLILPPGIDWLAYRTLHLWSPIFLPNVERIAPAKARFPEGVPVVVAAGGLDRKATPAESAAIAEHIGAMAKLVLFEKGQHSHLIESDLVRYRAEVAEFLDRAR